MDATFKGFNTIGQKKKFSMHDFELVKRDILNSFLIKLGEIPGRPGYGTTIHSIVFENLDETGVGELETEIRRVIASDPRVELISLKLYAQDHTILADVELDTRPDHSVEHLFLKFDTNQQSVTML